jgi:glyceraldehyde-3-phosphate dehydrogenase (NAD(P))
MPVRVAVNGYGTIGKRVADAIVRQPDLRLVGVSKTRPTFEAEAAVRKGYRLFVAGGGTAEDFEAAGLPVAGTVEELIDEADVIVDAAPDQIGRENAALYERARKRAIFQGGERPDVAEASFNALANFDECRGRSRLRVVSCNTTGLVRAAAVLRRRFGIERWDATIVRRAADPAESRKGPINGILPVFHVPSHHGPDVQSVLHDLPIVTTAVVVPTTLMHVHVNHVRFSRPPASTDELVGAFRDAPRFRIFARWQHVDGTPQVMEFARDRSEGRPDVMENVLWEEGVRVQDSDAYFFQAIHQESIVVPENIDALRAMFDLAPDAERSMAITDRALGIETRAPRIAAPAPNAR